MIENFEEEQRNYLILLLNYRKLLPFLLVVKEFVSLDNYFWALQA